MEILQGLREEPIPNTPEEYVKIYTNNRPTINEVVDKLKPIISKLNHNSNNNILSDTSTGEISYNIMGDLLNNHVSVKLKSIIPKLHHSSNSVSSDTSTEEVSNNITDTSLHGELSQYIKTLIK
ncbi:hypothetical protein RclHR1_03840003 [Rhizophagus clarus]|uniref:Uncharacterized protein n=1 Tax=Rhizophagus clarus TaxID=94130 RepID=A0A2Z6REK3_9GLOM|nr:hypothetical protein RclHR1_03840003 [Rhizophagus clarus]